MLICNGLEMLLIAFSRQVGRQKSDAIARVLTRCFLWIPILFSTACVSTSLKPTVGELKTIDAKISQNTVSADAFYPPIKLTKSLLQELLLAEFQSKLSDKTLAFQKFYDLGKKLKDPRFAQRALKVAREARRLDLTVKASELALNLTPKDAPFYDESLYRLVVLYAAINRFDLAKTIFLPKVQGMKFDEDSIPTVFDDLLLLSNKREVFKFLNEILGEKANNYSDPNFILAKAAYVSEESKIASDFSYTAWRLRPDLEKVIVLYSSLGMDPTAVLNALVEYLNRYPDSDKVRLIYAQKLVSVKNYELARVQYLYLFNRDKFKTQYAYTLGILLLQMDKGVEAIEYLEHFVKMPTEPNFEQYLSTAKLLLAEQYARKNKYQEAINILGVRLKDTTEISTQLQRHAYYLYKLGRESEIDSLFSSAITSVQAQQSPADAREEMDVYSAQISFWRERKNYAKALIVLAQWEKRQPQDVDLIYEQAITLEMMGKSDLAEEKFRMMMALYPDDYRGYNGLGYSLVDRNQRLEEAEVLLMRALVLSKNNLMVLDSWAWLQYRQGRLEESQLLLARLFMETQDMEIGNHLAEVLWVNQKFELAKKIWDQLKRKFPDQEIIEKTRQRLNVLN